MVRKPWKSADSESEKKRRITVRKGEKTEEVEGCARNNRTSHCVYPEEYDVYSDPVPTPSPTESQAPSFSPSQVPTVRAPSSSPSTMPTVKEILESSTVPPVPPTMPPTKRTNEANYEYTVTTKSPTFAPSQTQISPTSNPTKESTNTPTKAPTISNTETPTSHPTSESPTGLPTISPSMFPTKANQGVPTASPTLVTTTIAPTDSSTNEPTIRPTYTSSANSGQESPTGDSPHSESISQPTNAPSISNGELEATLGPTLMSEGGAGTGPRTSPTSAPTEDPSDGSTATPTTENGSTAAPTSSNESTASPTAARGSTTVPSQQTTSISTAIVDAPTTAPTPVTTGNANHSPTTTATPPTKVHYFNFPTSTTNPDSEESTTGCQSDIEGNFGITAPLHTEPNNVHLVAYRYQVETTPKFEITETDLNQAILRNVEKAISDIMVESFFPDAVCGPNVTKRHLTNQRMLTTNETTITEVVGLAADPPDKVLEGDLGVACPYPLVDADNDDMDVPPCFVVGGEMAFFMDSDNLGNLSWVDEKFQEDLKQAMIIGALDNVDPAIAYIRYIPPDTDLMAVTDDANSNNGNNSNTTTPNNVVAGEEKTENTILTAAPAWSWIVAGCGFMGVALVLALALYRKRTRVDESVDFDSVAKSPKGAFPVPIEIVDDNSEFDHDEIYKDDDEEEKEVESILDSSKPPSWRQVPEPPHRGDDEYSSLQINATDPNQPVVKPVLDEEAETYISTV